MDIKELKLLGGFNHPNIVRFVRVHYSTFMVGCLTLVGQLGVSIPEDTRVTPVMIVSELCSNGDLFDYVRNVPPPSLYRVVRPITPATYTSLSCNCSYPSCWMSLVVSSICISESPQSFTVIANPRTSSLPRKGSPRSPTSVWPR